MTANRLRVAAEPRSVDVRAGNEQDPQRGVILTRGAPRPSNPRHGVPSSSGPGIAVKSAFTIIGVGTDTGRSIRNPASTTGIVGLKPTHGLISRDGIVPLALSFDTAGPFARSVHDVEVALGVMAAIDPADTATKKSEGHLEADYTRYLKRNGLQGEGSRWWRGYPPNFSLSRPTWRVSAQSPSSRTPPSADGISRVAHFEPRDQSQWL